MSCVFTFHFFHRLINTESVCGKKSVCCVFFFRIPFKRKYMITTFSLHFLFLAMLNVRCLKCTVLLHSQNEYHVLKWKLHSELATK